MSDIGQRKLGEVWGQEGVYHQLKGLRLCTKDRRGRETPKEKMGGRTEGCS